ncbi:MAG TPA: outer membrane beta-barrel protein [Xanthobacteraceae bacterium]
MAARAQGPAVPAPQIFYSNVEPLAAQIARTQADPRPQSSDGALQVLDWLLYGSVGWGAACNFNLNLSPSNQIQACGPRFVPSVVAEHNTGIQRTFLYGVGDITWYPSVNQVQANDTTAGIVHIWEIQRDLIFRVQAQGKLDQNYSGLSGNLVDTSLFITTPLKYQQAYLSSSVQKNFASFFTAVGGSLTMTHYEDLRDNAGNLIDEHFQDGSISTLNGRLGYYISPIIYTYVEPSLNSQQYVDPGLNSHGYRIVAGIGSDRISLFNGEIHGGFAQQQFANVAIGTVSVPVFGGSLYWYPTRFLTVSYTADRVFGTSDFSQNSLTPAPIINPSTGLLPGSPTDNLTQTLKADWDFSRHFAFTAGIQSQQQNYLDSFRKDDLLTLSGAVTYKVTQTLGIQLTYRHLHLFTNLEGASFTSDFIGMGGSSKF